MPKIKLVIASFFAISPLVANADIIYDNGDPDTTNGFSILGSRQTQDDFNFGSSQTIDSVGFYFQNFHGITGWNQDISYNFYQDSGGAPGGLIDSGAGQNVTATLSQFAWCCGGGNAWLVTFDLMSALDLDAGTYWLGLTGATGSNAAWWVTTGVGNGRSGNSNVGVDFAFFLDGGDTVSVPEPGTLALFGIGLVGMGLGRRRKTL